MSLTIIKNVDEYLALLKQELQGSDPALIQDALFDAEEHLRTAWEGVLANSPNAIESEVLPQLVDKYGTPFEIAAVYREVEPYISPRPVLTEKPVSRSGWAGFYGILADTRAWGGFFYMLISILTGLIYGFWSLFGVAFSLFSLILIIGLPITGLFLLSVRGLALLEGRIVEVLLGVRMPRKPMFVSKDLNWRQKFKALITEPHTWKSLGHLILQLPLSVIYFTVMTTMFGFSLKMIFYPLLNSVLHRNLLNLGERVINTPVWGYPLVSLAGLLLLPLSLNLARWVGKVHGRLAKFMLIAK